MALLLSSCYVEDGIGTGWTIYPPLSRVLGHQGCAVDYLILSLHIGGVSSVSASINFLVTGTLMRVGGINLMRTRILV